MIIKTPSFNDNLLSDFKQLSINKDSPIMIHGSYKIKDNGSYITDIDIQTNVRYNQTLINILVYKIERSSSFIFIYMNFGIKKEFILPWKIYNNGDCDYDPDKVKTWYKTFKNKRLVPVDINTFIENKLFSDTISIRNLIDVENKLHNYSEIHWSLNDIKRGYITILNTKYVLLEMMKNDPPVVVLEFLYKTDNDFCLVDYALVDNKYKFRIEDEMYKYYTQDWYKIMKLFRWKIKRKYQPEYFEIMKKLDHILAIESRINLLEKVYKYKLTTKEEFINIENEVQEHLLKLNIKFDTEIRRKINNKVNNYLEKYIDHFKSKLNDNFADEFSLRFQRGLDSQLLLSKEIISLRFRYGIKCPFFLLDMNDYKQFFEISKKFSLSFKTVVDCFIKISDSTGNSINKLLKLTDIIVQSITKAELEFYLKRKLQDN